MKNILKSGINSNMLKTIAIIAMVIDHIGLYFEPILPPAFSLVCRYIGRIAMPIFVYLLVQGFFHTKKIKKYILRIGIFAVITQLIVTLIMVVNIKHVPNYITAKYIYTTGNILFSFVIALSAIKILHEDILIKKWEYNKNLSLKIICIIVLFLVTIFVPLDYGVETVIMSILMYYIEKLRIKIYIEKERSTNMLKNIVFNSISESKLKLTYLALILLAISTLLIYFNSRWTVLLAIIPIALYNGERGKKNMKYVYYVFFTLHHALLYLLALTVTLT